MKDWFDFTEEEKDNLIEFSATAVIVWLCVMGVVVLLMAWLGGAL